ncbi:hypothetical protein C1N83_28185 (plasmid) [Priestia aryabhattai]
MEDKYKTKTSKINSKMDHIVYQNPFPIGKGAYIDFDYDFSSRTDDYVIDSIFFSDTTNKSKVCIVNQIFVDEKHWKVTFFNTDPNNAYSLKLTAVMREYY